MDEPEPMDGAMGLPVKEEEGAFESAEEDQPSEEELQKWIKILSKSKKYQILPVGATGVGLYQSIRCQCTLLEPQD